MATQPPERSSVIFDPGYRPYRGRYGGRAQAFLTLFGTDLLRAAGWGRSWKYKVSMGLAGLFVLGQTLVLLAFDVATAPFASEAPRSLLNPHSASFDGLGLVLLLVAAVVAPDLFCNDRRYGVLALYRARPLTTHDYLLAKISALMAFLGAVLIAPQVLIYGGKILLSPEPWTYATAHLGGLLTALVAAATYAAYYSAYASGIAALTASRGVATASIIGVVVLSGVVSFLVFQATRNRYVLLLGDLDNAPAALKNALFGLTQSYPVPVFGGETVLVEPLSTGVYLTAVTAMIGAAALLLTRVYASERL